jgi:hypothetical protein
MQVLRKVLVRSLTAEAIDARCAQFALYAGAVGIILVGMQKLGTLAMTEAERFLGVLLVLAVGLLMVVLGTLTGLGGRLRAEKPS